ncbi:MAG: hypothetical protein IJT49_06175 [Clostridia bacterium]|nr:hypothetical protein [Clostridia bacterium]
MKRFILILTLISVLICAVSCGGKLKETYPDDLQTDAELKYTVILVDPDWPYYETADEAVQASTNVYSGKITDISFEVIDIVTGKAARDPESTDNTRMLYTVYTVEVKNNYKGETGKTVKIARIGGIKGYKMEDQYMLMELSGLLDTTSKSIPVYSSKCASPAEGNEYLFCTSRKVTDFDFVINPSQFVHSTGSSNANAIIKACSASEK